MKRSKEDVDPVLHELLSTPSPEKSSGTSSDEEWEAIQKRLKQLLAPIEEQEGQTEFQSLISNILKGEEENRVTWDFKRGVINGVILNIATPDAIILSSYYPAVKYALENDNDLWRELWLRDFPDWETDIGSELPEWVLNIQRNTDDERFIRVPWRIYHAWSVIANRRALLAISQLHQELGQMWIRYERVGTNMLMLGLEKPFCVDTVYQNGGLKYRIGRFSLPMYYLEGWNSSILYTHPTSGTVTEMTAEDIVQNNTPMGDRFQPAERYDVRQEKGGSSIWWLWIMLLDCATRLNTVFGVRYGDVNALMLEKSGGIRVPRPDKMYGTLMKGPEMDATAAERAAYMKKVINPPNAPMERFRTKMWRGEPSPLMMLGLNFDLKAFLLYITVWYVNQSVVHTDGRYLDKAGWGMGDLREPMTMEQWLAFVQGYAGEEGDWPALSGLPAAPKFDKTQFVGGFLE